MPARVTRTNATRLSHFVVHVRGSREREAQVSCNGRGAPKEDMTLCQERNRSHSAVDELCQNRWFLATKELVSE